MRTIQRAVLTLPEMDVIDPRLLAELIGEALRPLTYLWRDEKAVLVGHDRAKLVQALTREDADYLARIWSELPPLRRAICNGQSLGTLILSKDFQPYLDAFEQASDRPGWALHVYWHTGVNDQRRAQQEHEVELRRRIEIGALQALTRCRVPTLAWSEAAFVLMTDAADYLRQIGVELGHGDAVSQGPRDPSKAAIDPEDRAATRLQMCIDAGLTMPATSLGRMPRGVGKIADQIGISRQAFVEDVKRAIDRRASTVVHRIE